MKDFNDFLKLLADDDFNKKFDNIIRMIMGLMLVFMIWYDSQLVCAQHTRDLFYMIKKYPELVYNSSTEIDMINKINSDSERMKSCQLTCNNNDLLNEINSTNKVDIGINN
jgi:hypothetical protein